MVLNPTSFLRPCLAKTRKPIFGLFSHFCYLALSLFINLHITYTYYTLASHLFTNSIIAYKLIDLCHLCPQVVNDHFTLVSNIHFESLILFPKNFILLLIYLKQVRKMIGYILGCYRPSRTELVPVQVRAVPVQVVICFSVFTRVRILAITCSFLIRF